MVKVVIVNGMPCTGKTTFQEICRDKLKDLRWCTAIKSSVEWVKEVATFCGWDGTKTDKNRKFLSDLKSLLSEWDDAVVKRLVDVVNGYYYTGCDWVVFIDIREPYEIERAKEVFNATTLMVRRPEVEDATYSNTSDMGVFAFGYDYTVWNDEDLARLELEADKFIDTLMNDTNIYYRAEENYNE
jgi:hypothetical protein